MAKINRKDDPSFKICRECNLEKPREDFAKNQIGKDNRILRRPICKTCYSAKKPIPPKIRKEYELKHPKPKPSRENPFICPICRRNYYGEHLNQIVLDHSHKSGKIRGWICGSCNASIGKFKEDISILQRAISWLKGIMNNLF